MHKFIIRYKILSNKNTRTNDVVPVLQGNMELVHTW